MTTLLRECGICDQSVPDGETMWRGYVSRTRNQGRLRWHENRWVPICAGCVRQNHDELRWAFHDGRTHLFNIADGEDAVPCEGCGQPVVVDADRRRKVVTCGDLCRSRYYGRTRSVAASVTQCEGCGAAMEGRADRRYCSPACRQRAYRARVTA